MKILIASDTFLPRWDGVVRFLNEIIIRLKKKHEITVLAPDYGEIQEPEGYKLFRVPVIDREFGDYYPPRPNLSEISKLVKQSDIVFVQAFGPIGMMATLLANRHHVPAVFYMHIVEWKTLPKSAGKSIFKNLIHILSLVLTKFFYNRCDLIIVPSLEMVEILTWRNITPKKKIVHLGVNVNEFKPAKNKAYAKRNIGINPNDIVIGYVGRLAYEKDLRTLYWAFKRIKQDNVKLMIVGSGRKDIEKMFAHKKNIILAGKQNNVVPYLQAMDMHVLPSLIETTSLVTLEAMSCGLPVLATPVGYIIEYIKDEENGFLFNAKDTFMLYTKMMQLVKSKTLREKIGKEARKTVVEKFSWEKTIKEIEKIFEEI